MQLLQPIELPDRSGIRTNGDMVRVLMLDEEAISLKNGDLAVLRKMLEQAND